MLRTPWVTTWGNSSQHQGGGFGFDQLNIVKNPLVVPIKATAMVLERKWISAIPQGFFGYGKPKVLRNLIFFPNLFYEIVDWHKCLIIDDLHEWFVLVCFELRLSFLISFFRAHYIPPTCTHGILSPHWVFLYSTLLYSLFLQDRNSWLYVGVHA